ncbi:MAG TPA: thioesterase family protein [Jatrophihabitans sp.]|nr:thioesterase family protein [Jatrophihabitans sp.]
MSSAVTWSAPVRYAEVDGQGVVFNANYLLYCDEAMGAFCAQRGLLDFAARIRLAASSLVWSGPAHWGDVMAVEARCVKVGRTSLTMTFDLRASGRACCAVETTYVYADEHGTPLPIPDPARAALLPA